MNNKWIRAAIPALLIHCSIGKKGDKQNEFR